MDRNDAVDGGTRRQVAALLAIGKDPVGISKATGIPVSVFASIVKEERERLIEHKAAAKRGLDPRGVLLSAAAYQKAASNDPWAPVPADIAAVVRRKVEIDPGLAGLDRRILVAFATMRKDEVLGDLFQVGVEDAWTSINMLAGRYVVPAGAEWTEGWNKEVSWGRVECYVDVAVEAMTQSINPSSLLLLRGVMDWGLWGLRAGYVVKHDEVIGRFDSYRNRQVVASSRRDGASNTSRVLDHELARQLIGDKAAGDEDTARECYHKHAWAPFVAFDPAWQAEWLERVVLVLYDPPVQGQRQLDALANMFPVATLYTGECRVWYGGDKARTRRVAVVDALVPKSTLTMMTDHVGAVAGAVVPHPVIMPECHALAIPYPDGYPTGDITWVYRPGGVRATALRGQRIASFSEHWATQRAIDT